MKDALFLEMKKPDILHKNGQRYLDFRKTLTPRWGRIYGDIGFGWLALVAIHFALVFFSGFSWALGFLLVPVGALLFGYFIAYLQLFLHEAAHHNIHPQKNLNDLFCNLFVSGITGLDVRTYRVVHREHHRHLGTPMDTEITYFSPLNFHFLLEFLFGRRILKVLQTRKKTLEERAEEGVPKSSRFEYPFLVFVLLNGSYLGYLVWSRLWIVAMAWLGGLLVFFPFFGALRQLLEHRSDEADDTEDYTKKEHGMIHRLFGDGLLASTLGGAGFNRHLLHHWEPEVSYTRLSEIEAFLMDTDCASYLASHQTTYLQTFFRLFRPRWR